MANVWLLHDLVIVALVMTIGVGGMLMLALLNTSGE